MDKYVNKLTSNPSDYFAYAEEAAHVLFLTGISVGGRVCQVMSYEAVEDYTDSPGCHGKPCAGRVLGITGGQSLIAL